MPHMQSVESGHIASVGYDEETQDLHIEFKNGRTYIYPMTPIQMFRELMDSPSKGQFINRRLKGKPIQQRED